MDWITTLLLVVLGLEVSVATSADGYVVRLLAVFSIVILTAATVARWTARRVFGALDDANGMLPGRVTVERQDGRTTALVTTVAGDPLVFDVPEDIVDAGADAVFLWIVDQIASS